MLNTRVFPQPLVYLKRFGYLRLRLDLVDGARTSTPPVP